MKTHWSRVSVLSHYDHCPYRRGNLDTDSNAQRAGDVKRHRDRQLWGSQEDRPREDSPLKPPQGAWSCPHLDFRLWPPDGGKRNVCCLSHQVCSTVLAQPRNHIKTRPKGAGGLAAQRAAPTPPVAAQRSSEFCPISWVQGVSSP